MSASTTTVRRVSLTVPAAVLGPENPLPRFDPLRALPPMRVGPEASPEMRQRVSHGQLASPLPYAMQEDYGRDLTSKSLPAIELDNGILRAVVLPGLGGRVWSLQDRARGRELLFVNPVLAFASFGLTNAWFAGGIEWNLGSTGHATHSNRPFHAAVVTGPDGPLLRLWEWERTRDLVLQVDLSLPPGSDRLFASTRVINPDPVAKPLYYWTNIAVPETPGTRVLAESDHAWRTDYAGVLSRVPVPHPDRDDVDISRPSASRDAADYFFEVEDQVGRHVVSVEPDGRGFAQTSTAALRGRKLFLWGQGPGGARWQEWLCGPEARYAEIQAGRCPTQLEHDTLPGHAVVSWTEAFGAVDLDPAAVAGPWAGACEAARDAVHAAASPDQLEDRHARWLAAVADLPVDEVLATGSGWGSIELRLRGAAGWPGLPFPAVDDESLAASALLDGDTELLDATADRLPVPPVSDLWAATLETAPEHWWVLLARAVNAQLRGDGDAASSAYARSAELRETPWALRGLASLASASGRYADAAALLERARSRAPEVRGLATELLECLLADGRAEDGLAVLDTLPPIVRDHGRTRLLEVRALVASGRREEASSLLDGIVVEDLAEGETVLGDLWRELHPGAEIPTHLDFSMVAEPIDAGRQCP